MKALFMLAFLIPLSTLAEVRSDLSRDRDGDNVVDVLDNCLEVPNSDQQNSDFDAFGDACDLDFDQSNWVDIRDYIIFFRAFGKKKGEEGYLPGVDCNKDDIIAIADFSCLAMNFGLPPGPSGLELSVVKFPAGSCETGTLEVTLNGAMFEVRDSECLYTDQPITSASSRCIDPSGQLEASEPETTTQAASLQNRSTCQNL